MSIVEQSHAFLLPVLHRGAICIDATLGHGKDSLFFLAHKVKKVYGFEIQQAIFNDTMAKIADDHFQGILDGHQKLATYVKEEVDAIIFNFGFCPGGDENITTQASTSLDAVQQALKLLKKKGRMVLVMYPHDIGRQEALMIETYLAILAHHDYYIAKNMQLNCDNSPYLINIERLR
ncbi:MAG: class I SAM-dependent methyltransferase [Erysipelotrichaceae bacterium]|nr:class I SAM-dependent methyltransferase [Erysipelotrichaceae bacterium]